MELVVVGLPGQRQDRDRAARGGAPRRDVRRPRRADRARGGHARSRRSSSPRARPASGGASERRSRRSAPADGGPDADPGHRAGRRRDRRPAQPLAALPRPAHGLARRPARGRRPAPSPEPHGATARRRPRPDGHDPRARRGARAGSTRPRRASPGVAEMASVVGAVDDVLRGARDRRARCCSEPRRGSGGSSSATGSSPASSTRRSASSRRGARSSSPSRGRGPPSARGSPRRSRADGWPVERVLLPQGEDAKRLSVIEDRGQRAGAAPGRAARAARGGRRRRARRRGRVPRRDVPPRRAVHPGPDDARRPARLLDRRQDRRRPAGGQEPRRRVPPAGRDRRSTSSVLASLDVRQRRAALAEAVKMAALGDERLFETLEADGAAIAAGDAAAIESGALAEVVERAAWAKVEVVARRRARGGRPHRAEPRALAGPRDRGGGRLPRPAPRRGGRVRPARRGADRGRAGGDAAGRGPSGSSGCSTRSSSGVAPLTLDLDAVLGILATDKKHAGGALRWVLPTADGHAIDAEVPEELVREVAAAMLAGRPDGRCPWERCDDPDPRPPGPEPEPARDPRAGDLRLGDARPDPHPHQPPGARPRPRGDLLPVEPRGRAHRPAARARLRRRRSSTRAA